jgi:hypothetical protein
MRLDIKALHRSRRKLHMLQATVKSQFKNESSDFTTDFCEAMAIPTPEECKVLLDLIQEAEYVLYPSQQEIDIHEYQISLLHNLDSITEPDKCNQIAENVREFERKYCT